MYTEVTSGSHFLLVTGGLGNFDIKASGPYTLPQLPVRATAETWSWPLDADYASARTVWDNRLYVTAEADGGPGNRAFTAGSFEDGFGIISSGGSRCSDPDLLVRATIYTAFYA